MPASGGIPATGLDESKPLLAATAEGRVAWVEAGPTNALDAPAPVPPPLVLIHGFTGHRDDFISVIPELAQSRRVIAPDLRGHGDSEKTAGALGWFFEQLVKDLVAFLDHLGLDRVDLLGHSMGGFLVLRFALTHPERVRSLIFLCTGPETPTAIPRQGFLKAASIADARGIDGLQILLEKVGRIEPSPTIAGWGERYWLHHRRRFGAMTAESYRGLGTTFFDSASLVSRLGEVEQPTLVLVGQLDQDWLPGANLFKQHLPAAQRRTIANAEHHPHVENGEAFLSALESHFDEVSAAEAADT